MSDVPARTFDGYAYGGVRALVELHDRHLRSFVASWKRAARDGVRLPASDDPDCRSLEALLRHVLGASRGYLLWLCEQLSLPAPGIAAVPEDVAGEVDPTLDALLDAWDGPLRSLDQPTADRSVFTSRWGVAYCVDAMLEHAVMHPIRHELQLERARGGAGCGEETPPGSMR